MVTASSTKRFAAAFGRGLAQVAFCDTVPAGLLVLAAIALVSPWCGLGAALGAAFGTAAGAVLPERARGAWDQGLAGYNPAIIGIFWGGFFAAGSWEPALLLAVLGACALAEAALRRALSPWSLPALSLPAVVTAVAVSLVLAPPGTWFWIDVPGPAFGPAGLALAAVCVVAAMTMTSATGAALALLCTAAALLGIGLSGQDPRDWIGLWALTVPLASFAVSGVFLRHGVAGALGGALAAGIGAAIWLLWSASALADLVPPLLAPFILGVWLALLAMRRLQGTPWFQAGVWRAAAAIGLARREGRPVAALTAGDDPDSTFLSGAWLDAQVPGQAFGDARLKGSLRCRRAFWAAGERLRRDGPGGPNALHRGIARFKRDGWLGTILTQEVDATLEDLGASGVVHLHGRRDRVACLDCAFEGPWPPGEVWRRCDLRCPACSGFLKPAVTLVGDAAGAQAAAARALDRCGVLLVLGAQVAEPLTESLLAQARAAGGRVVFVTEAALRYRLAEADIVIDGAAARVLPALAVLLAARRLLRVPKPSLPMPKPADTLRGR